MINKVYHNTVSKITPTQGNLIFANLFGNIDYSDPSIKQTRSKFETKKRKFIDDEIIFGKEQVSFNCPLSLLRITDPIKSKTCNHIQSFDLSSCFSVAIVKNGFLSFKCVCCNAEFFASDLIIDFEFKRLLNKYSGDGCFVWDGGDCEIESVLEEKREAVEVIELD